MDGKMCIIGNAHQVLQIEQAAILVLQLFQANWIDVMDVDPRKNNLGQQDRIHHLVVSLRT